MTQTMELLIIASIIAIIADLGWLMHDILVNGFSIAYALVLSGLGSGLILTCYAGWWHHVSNYKCEVKTRLQNKLKISKAKKRHYSKERRAS